MTTESYQEQAMLFRSDIQCNGEQSDMLYAALGLTGEAGEFAELIKKHVFQTKPLDKEHAKRELGDICWYLALACSTLGISIDDVLQANIEKLVARYPNLSFSVEHANNRAEDDV